MKINVTEKGKKLLKTMNKEGSFRIYLKGFG